MLSELSAGLQASPRQPLGRARAPAFPGRTSWRDFSLAEARRPAQDDKLARVILTAAAYQNPEPSSTSPSFIGPGKPRVARARRGCEAPPCAIPVQPDSGWAVGGAMLTSPATISPVNVNFGPKIPWLTGACAGSKNTVKAKLSPAEPPPGPPSTASISKKAGSLASREPTVRLAVPAKVEQPSFPVSFATRLPPP